MLIKQINEFELRGYGPPGRIVLLQLVIFMTKQKSLKIIFEWIIAGTIASLKYCRNNIPYFPLSGQNHLQSLTPTCNIVNEGLNNFIFYWFSDLKHLVF